MLTLENIKTLATKNQTNEKNALREYVQHLFLASLYRLPESEKLLFKGGTVLRIIFGSPRFSEDLDFTGIGICRPKNIDELFLETLDQLEKTGLAVSYQEAKPTSGGFLGIIRYTTHGFEENLKFEVSLRGGRKIKGEVVNIISSFAPPYLLIHLPSKELVAEKIAALLARRKPRDYYDLYFLLRYPELNRLVDKKQLVSVLKNIQTEKFNFKKELSVLLPINQHMLLKDFPNLLTREIKKFV